MKPICSWLMVGVVAALLAFSQTGCVTTAAPADPEDNSGDSDLPWNQQQPWEGTIPMPMPSGGGF